jgi:hypothetical protein
MFSEGIMWVLFLWQRLFKTKHDIFLIVLGAHHQDHSSLHLVGVVQYAD